MNNVKGWIRDWKYGTELNHSGSTQYDTIHNHQSIIGTGWSLATTGAAPAWHEKFSQLLVSKSQKLFNTHLFFLPAWIWEWLSRSPAVVPRTCLPPTCSPRLIWRTIYSNLEPYRRTGTGTVGRYRILRLWFYNSILIGRFIYKKRKPTREAIQRLIRRTIYYNLLPSQVRSVEPYVTSSILWLFSARQIHLYIYKK